MGLLNQLRLLTLASCLVVSTNAQRAYAAPDARGGGWTGGGPLGQYYANADLSGEPAFQRRDVRVDFDWGTAHRPGGVNSRGFSAVGNDNFSIRWRGTLLPRFSESYKFFITADDGVRFRIKKSTNGSFDQVIDSWTTSGTFEPVVPLEANVKYDVEIEYCERTGPAQLKVYWEGPSFKKEVIDTVRQIGLNTVSMSTDFYADLMKTGRNNWHEGHTWNGVPGNLVDPGTGWPRRDAGNIINESFNQGYDIPLTAWGKINFSFQGRGSISLFGNYNWNQPGGALQSVRYDQATNTTSGSVFSHHGNHINVLNFAVLNTDRDGVFVNNQPNKDGFTNLKLMRPRHPIAKDITGPVNDTYPDDVLFTDHAIDALSNHFTVLRTGYFNASQASAWGDRTLPAFFNQVGGKNTAPRYPDIDPESTPNGPSYEYQVQLANATGRDLYLNLPIMATGWNPADKDSYIYKLALLLKYGSDGVEPYTSPQSDPVYPPLNSNLRVYLEVTNEIWNYAVGFRQFHDLLRMTKLSADEALGASISDPLARAEDFAILNYDNLSTAKDSQGNYGNIWTWRLRYLALRTAQMSFIFRAVFGDDQMMTRVRPLHEWQYGNLNGTAQTPLVFLDEYFNNANGKKNVETPRPVNEILWGGGGASYYSSGNSEGSLGFVPNGSVETPAISGQVINPEGSSWSFTGNAGIAKAGGTVPPAAHGQQVLFLTGQSSASVQITVPEYASASHSGLFGISFKTVNAPGSAQFFDVLVNGTKVNAFYANALSFQDGSYRPPVRTTWEAYLSWWTGAVEFYPTKLFKAAPGEKVTLTFQAKGNASHTAFIDYVLLTSPDAIAENAPGGGEALGQPRGLQYRNFLQESYVWAHALGLEGAGYEGGCSLGGDTGGSPTQNHARYIDQNMAAADVRAANIFTESGGALNTFGVYYQWPDWTFGVLSDGFPNPGKYPLMRAKRTILDQLAPIEKAGILVPNLITAAMASLHSPGASAGSLSRSGAWSSFSMIAPQPGEYDLKVSTVGGGTVRIILNGTTIAEHSANTPYSGKHFLHYGLNSLRIQSTNGSSSISSIAISAPNAPETPEVVSVNGESGKVTIEWRTAQGADHYVVYWGTAAGQYLNSQTVTDGDQVAISNLMNNVSYFFTVVAVGTNGARSAPAAEFVAIPNSSGSDELVLSFNASLATPNQRTLKSAVQHGALLGSEDRDITLKSQLSLRPSHAAWGMSKVIGFDPATWAASATQAKEYEACFRTDFQVVAGRSVQFTSSQVIGAFQSTSTNFGYRVLIERQGKTLYEAPLSSATGNRWDSALTSLPPITAADGVVKAYLCPFGGLQFTFASLGVNGGSNNLITFRGKVSSITADSGITVTANVPKAYLGNRLLVPLSAEGGKAPYLWRVSSGRLPTGVALAQTAGFLTGTPLERGAFPLTITVADAAGASKSVATSLEVVTGPKPNYAQGSFWMGREGDLATFLRDSAYPLRPDVLVGASGLTAPWPGGNSSWTTNFGYEASALLTPTVSGNYTFYVRGDDAARLLLSTDGSRAKSVVIAEAPTSQWTYTASPKQKSVAIPLEAGKSYFIAATMKQGLWSSLLSVAWEGPGISQTEIPPAYLSAPISPPLPGTFKDLSWTGSSPKIAWLQDAASQTVAFWLERKKAADIAWTRVAILAADAREYLDTAAVPGEGYHYRLTTINQSGLTVSEPLNVRLSLPENPKNLRLGQ